ESGLMARRLSTIRSGLQTFALTTSEDVRNQLALIWGVLPFYDKDLNPREKVSEIGEKTVLDLLDADSNTTEDMLRIGEKTLIDAGLLEHGETIIMMAGRLSGFGLSSSVIVWSIGERVPRR